MGLADLGKSFNGFEMGAADLSMGFDSFEMKSIVFEMSLVDVSKSF